MMKCALSRESREAYFSRHSLCHQKWNDNAKAQLSVYLVAFKAFGKLQTYRSSPTSSASCAKAEAAPVK